MTTILEFEADSSKGLTHSVNEDCYIIGDRYVALADGMGGCVAGDVAAKIVVDTVREYMENFNLRNPENSSKDKLRRYMFEIIAIADMHIKEYADSNPGSRGLGSTVVFAIFEGATANVAWCGDSAAYIYEHHGKGGKLRKLTKDHTYVQDLVEANEIKREDAFTHDDNHLLTRFAGAGIDCSPEFLSCEFKEGDIFLLCTDGLSGYCELHEMENIMHGDGNIPGGLKELAISRGSDDDISIVIVKRRSRPGMWVRILKSLRLRP